MAIIRKLIPKKHKELFSSSTSPPRYTRLSSEESNDWEVRKGHVPVVVGVGEEEGVKERFLIPTHLLSHPVMISLLESAAEEFGYGQEGVLQIPHDPDSFREILLSLSFKKT